MKYKKEYVFKCNRCGGYTTSFLLANGRCFSTSYEIKMEIQNEVGEAIAVKCTDCGKLIGKSLTAAFKSSMFTYYVPFGYSRPTVNMLKAGDVLTFSNGATGIVVTHKESAPDVLLTTGGHVHLGDSRYYGNLREKRCMTRNFFFDAPSKSYGDVIKIQRIGAGPGLQLTDFDPKTWVNMPVIWNGIFTKEDIKPGMIIELRDGTMMYHSNSLMKKFTSDLKQPDGNNIIRVMRQQDPKDKNVSLKMLYKYERIFDTEAGYRD